MRTDKARQAIKVAMVKGGIVGAEVARRLGVSRQAVYMVIAGRVVSRRIGEALIEAGVPARLLPEYAPAERPRTGTNG